MIYDACSLCAVKAKDNDSAGAWEALRQRAEKRLEWAGRFDHARPQALGVSMDPGPGERY
jgi:hypothetical protein